MNLPTPHSALPNRSLYFAIAITCLALGALTSTKLSAQTAPTAESAAATTTTDAAAAPETPSAPAQLASLVAPIALFPDPLLSQTLVASTYPVEVIQLQQWMAK